MKLGLGGKLLAVLLGLGIIAYALERYVGAERLLGAVGVTLDRAGALAPGDFPAGASAPAEDVAALPSRPIRLAAVLQGATAGLLWTVGGERTGRDAPLSKGYGLEAELRPLADGSDAAGVLALPSDRGGADLVAMPLEELARVRPTVRDAVPRAVALLGFSRGLDGLAAGPGAARVEDLKGRTVAVAPGSAARFFTLWRLAQSGLHERSVRFMNVSSPTEAARTLQEGRVDAAAGRAPELSQAVRERGGKVLATTADAPHLCATVLVARGEFAARYPEAVRRVVRAAYDAAEAVAKDPLPAAQLLGPLVPQLGDPREAIADDAPARLGEALAFFGVEGDAPVRYEELYGAAAAIWAKLGETADRLPPAESRDLAPLRAAKLARERAAAEGR